MQIIVDGRCPPFDIEIRVRVIPMLMYRRLPIQLNFEFCNWLLIFVNFEGKSVIVTGASSGIGRAISVELDNDGANVILIGRKEETLNETGRLLTSGNHHIIPLELGDHSEIVPRVVDFARKNGRIYGMCHAAGVVETRPLSSCKREGIQAMLDVNLISGIEIVRAACRRDIMEETGGSILFISSIYALVGMPGQIGYSASKGAVTAAMRAMAIELARRNIMVNSISPGLVRTDMTEKALSVLTGEQVMELEESFPLGIGKPEDVAHGRQLSCLRLRIDG